MKLALCTSFYRDYLDSFYSARPHLENESYARQLEVLLDDGFGWPPALFRKMREHGHEVEFIIINAYPLQKAWAREYSVVLDQRNWQQQVALEQASRFKPDVLWMGSMFNLFGSFLQKISEHCHRVIAWIAVQPPSGLDMSGVDLVVSSHSTFVDLFRERGFAAEKLLPAFEPSWLKRARSNPRDVVISFVGSLTAAHPARIRLLRRFQRHYDLQIWSPKPRLLSRVVLQRGGVANTLRGWQLARASHPQVFGLDMYRVLGRSRMVVNVHIEAAGGLAGNMRMFETTGMGALLLTEDFRNLKEIFSPDDEVVAYSSFQDLDDKVSYLLKNPDQLDAIAHAGQRRTLRDHSTAARAAELEEMLCQLLERTG